jgi:hypothetical protein
MTDEKQNLTIFYSTQVLQIFLHIYICAYYTHTTYIYFLGLLAS